MSHKNSVIKTNSQQVGAVEKIRTSTESPPQRPQRCASTSSATTAFGAIKSKSVNNCNTQSRMPSVEWIRSSVPVAYQQAVGFMEARVRAIREGTEAELVWLLEHPHIYTAGTSAKQSDIVDQNRCPVHVTGRGGQVTYHGPGQRVAYVMLDLQKRQPDLQAYVRDLEQWIINTLLEFNIAAERRKGRVGLWVSSDDGKEAKVAAIGVRVKQWVTFHGIALNVDPDLSYYQGIVPCGIRDHGITSMAKLGVEVTLQEVDDVLKRQFEKVFG